MADSRKSGKWRAVMKKPAVRHTLKAVSAVFKCLMTILLIGVITATMVGCVMVVYVMINFKDNDGIPTELGQMSMKATTTVEVQNDKGEWEVFQQLKGTNSIWVDGDEIPQCMKDAVVAIEDERFYDHYGVDWKRTISAFANLIFHFSSTEYGGSTITQQLIKITTQDDDHSIERKITEILRAIEMEKNYYTKPEILEAYLNNLPLTGDIVGVGAGAQYYFGKDVRDLSIAEGPSSPALPRTPANTTRIPAPKTSAPGSAWCSRRCMSWNLSPRKSISRRAARSCTLKTASSTPPWKTTTWICLWRTSSRISWMSRVIPTAWPRTWCITAA